MLRNSSVINSLVCLFAVYKQPYHRRCQNEHSTSYPLDMVGGGEDGGGGGDGRRGREGGSGKSLETCQPRGGKNGHFRLGTLYDN